MQVYGNDHALKARLIQRFDAAVMSTPDRTVGLAAALSDDGVIATCAATLGCPLGLVALADELAVYMHAHPSTSHAFARSFLTTLRVGADAEDVPTMLALDMLAEAEAGTIRDAVMALHCRVLARNVPSRTEWKLVRESATATTDNSSKQRERVAYRLIEAAAWPVTSSRSVLCDMFRALTEFEHLDSAAAAGWTSADSEAIDAKLEALWEAGTAERERGDPFDILARLRKTDPELATRHDAILAAGPANILIVAKRVATLLIQRVEALSEDPHLWLEEIDGARALGQVRTWNERTRATLASSPGFTEDVSRVRTILDDPRRIPGPQLLGAHVYNFWQDSEHVRGVWRRTTREAYLNGAPVWELLIDVDTLAAAEQRKWVFSGADLSRRDPNRVMISLSDGGRDAVTWREFDIDTRRFLDEGFAVEEAKTDLTWLDADTLLIATPMGSDTLTDSGYPRQLRRWSRGTLLTDAPVIATVSVDSVSVSPFVEMDAERLLPAVIRQSDFWHSTVEHVRDDGSSVQAPIPDTANVQAYIDGWFVVKLNADWVCDDTTISAGSLIAYAIDPLLARQGASIELVMRAPSSGAIEGVVASRTLLYVVTTEHVVSQLWALRRIGPGDWRAFPIAAPAGATIGLGDASVEDDLVFFSAESMTLPSTLFAVADGGVPKPIASQMAHFDPASMRVEQRFAISADGTRVPYFLARPAGAVNALPTLMYGYGGFRASMRAGYLSPLAQAWIGEGNAFVLANLRGGGEYGPAWHEAALRENRQRAFDDLHAIAADLKDTGLATRIAFYGGSNGGLTAGVALTQRPDLYEAVIMGAPLADMRRYHTLLAGASWMSEYGDPDDPEDWNFISRYSPYHNVRSGVDYPSLLLITSSKDDRVHPGHARKMAARMQSLGYEVDYWENTEGGHAGATNSAELAHRAALILAFLRRELGVRTPALF